jgi:hypothetical protein
VAPPRAPADATGLQLLQLSYSVQWPVSLVINQARLVQYQLLFRFLLALRLAEREVCAGSRALCACLCVADRGRMQLSRSWLAGTPWTYRTSATMTRAFGLRHRMLTLVQSLQTYTMVEVLEPHWHEFDARLNEVRAPCHALLFARASALTASPGPPRRPPWTRCSRPTATCWIAA